MDTKTSYRIVFSGRLLAGFEPDEVKRALATELQLSPDKVASLFSGKKHVLKTDNPHLRKASWWERLVKGGRFPIL